MSFVIPVLNKEPYLRQCLASVLSQSLRRTEVICVDDGSQDGSREILRELAQQDLRVKLVFNERNLGPGPSRNRGLEIASGEFVRLVDADDLLPAASTEAMFIRARETGADLVRGALARFEGDDPGNNPWVVRVPDRLESSFCGDPTLWVPWWHTSYLIAAHLIRDHTIRYPNLRRGEDPVFMATVLTNCSRVSLINDVVYLYRAYNKATGSAGDTFADVVDSFHHAARVKAIYHEHCPPAWTEGYGPFLLADFREYIDRCRLDREQSWFVNAEAERIWGSEAVLATAAPAQASDGQSASAEKDYWNHHFWREDPWDYASAYEQTKYHHALELLPDGEPLSHALEIGCAEGIFTNLLAPRTQRLLAIDISGLALARARQCCLGWKHVRFLEYDIADGVPGDSYDLIVCSETLYYLRDGDAVAAFAHHVRNSLAIGGHLLLTHSTNVSDDRTETGFDFHEIGAKFIGEIFATCPGLEFLRELRTELYRVQLFRRSGTGAEVADAVPREVVLRRHAHFSHPSIKWGGCAVTAAEANHLWRLPHVPVLMYHRIADDGPAALAPYRVSPVQFERQLAWLQRHGWHGLNLDDYCQRRYLEGQQDFPGKPVILTFDDAYDDFYHHAWPLLRRYGFPATVFVPVDFVGGRAEWDSGLGPAAAIMTWEQITDLHRQGAAFGSHGCLHLRPTEMTPVELFSDSVRSKLALEEKLDAPVPGYCYPFAAADSASRRIIAEVGYKWAVCGRGDVPPERDDPHYVPRIEIFGSDTLEQFMSRLPRPVPTRKEQQNRFFELRARRDRATYMGR